MKEAKLIETSTQLFPLICVDMYGFLDAYNLYPDDCENEWFAEDKFDKQYDKLTPEEKEIVDKEVEGLWNSFSKNYLPRR